MCLPKHNADGIVLARHEVDAVRRIRDEDRCIQVVIRAHPAGVSERTDPCAHGVVDAADAEGVGAGLLRVDVAAVVQDEVIRGHGVLVVDGYALWRGGVVESAERGGGAAVFRCRLLDVLG